MARKKILIIEDNKDIQELVSASCSRDGYEVATADSGEEGLRRAGRKLPDLVLLDLMLPGMDGLEVCKRLKANENTRYIPVIMLTAKGEETDIVLGLELGADDYITKPFSCRELLARIKAVLRRKPAPVKPEAEVVRIHDLWIHPGRHEVRWKEKPLTLTTTEFRLLHFLARQPGWVFTRYQIVDGVHGEDYPVTDRSIDVQIAGLRKKLGSAGQYIETVRGVGYRFKE